MSELYWITRLGAIIPILIIALTISIVVCAVALISYYEDNEKASAKSVLKKASPILAITTLLVVFVPTKNEALLIWGLGGTIDYIKSNEVVKQLPDKCINALDVWVDSLTEEKEEK